MEFAFGPVFKIVKTTEGYFENTLSSGLEGDRKWHRENEWASDPVNWKDGNSSDVKENKNEIDAINRFSANNTQNMVLFHIVYKMSLKNRLDFDKR